MITILISSKVLRLVSLGMALAALLLVTACREATADDDELNIVATTSIWGDVVSQLVGDDATVEILIPTGADAHDFEPTSSQIAALHEADLVVANGIGLEETMEDALQSAIADGANVFEVAAELDPLPFVGDEHENDSEVESDEHPVVDPHVWFDPLRVATGAELIAQRLAQIDNSVDWQKRAADYAIELAEIDDEITEIVSVVAPEDRKLVTSHQAFGYFAHRYGFEVIGVVVPGGSTLADPSSADLANLVEKIEQEGVDTIFAETTQPTRLAEAVAAEAGRDVSVVELYTESLGQPSSGADSLIGILSTNARRIAEALAR